MAAPKKAKSDLTAKLLAKLAPYSPDAVRSSETDVPSSIKFVLSTGLDPVDEYTGYIPFGRIVELYGLEGSGKTALAMRCCVRAQMREIYEKTTDEKGHVTLTRIDPDREVIILYIDNEQSLDEGEKISVDGVEVDAIIDRCDTIDEVFKKVDDTLSVLEAAADDPAKAPLAIVIVDTIAGTTTEQEINAEWGSQDYPRSPKQLRSAFSKLTRRVNRHNMLLICTNQVGSTFAAKPKRRTNPFAVDLPRPEDFPSSGGRALKFYASLRIFLFPVNLDYKLQKSVGGPDGFISGFITVKNRQVKPRREGRVVLLFDRGFTNTFSRLESMLKCKTITRGEKGVLEFHFAQNGIEVTTFPNQRANTNPKIESTAAWPAFYESHQVDIDALWRRTVDLTFGVVDACEADADEEAAIPD